MNKWLCVCGLLFLGGSYVEAQPLSLRKQVVAAAGGSMADAGGGRLLGTLGEAIVGWTASEALGHGAGFWYEAEAQPVAVSEVVGQAWHVRLWPNPASGSAWLEVQWEEGGALRASLYDAGGRRLCEWWPASPWPAGTHLLSLSWGALPAGLYWVRVETCGAAPEGCKQHWLPLAIQP